jgi:23S rRNA (cytosine1962-C5)-methyltransferase
VFSGGIESVSGTGAGEGGFCTVVDDRDQPLGAGYYNPRGVIAVRLLEHRRTTEVPFEPRPPEVLLDERLRASVKRRESLGLMGGPGSTQTTAYRLVNSEGDGLSGLAVDRLGDTLVVAIGSRAMYELRKSIVERVLDAVGASRLVVRVNEEASRLEAIPVGAEWAHGAPGPVDFREHGIAYHLDPTTGQKTGFYCDQRENRRAFAAHCRGRSVLDLYSYVGAFGLNAAAEGATSVTAVDSSVAAVEGVRRHAEAAGARIEAVHEDSMAYLKAAIVAGRTWDRIVCDPPKLARSRGHLEEALKKYVRLNTLALEALAPEGLLLTCSCSRHVSVDAFLRVLTEASHRLRRRLCVHALWGQASDHPWLSVAPEGAYLKVALVSLSGA